jgi:hypothetical protein
MPAGVAGERAGEGHAGPDLTADAAFGGSASASAWSTAHRATTGGWRFVTVQPVVQEADAALMTMTSPSRQSARDRLRADVNPETTKVSRR